MKNSASIFRELHNNSTPLILPLAWDAASARIIQNAGAKAIATSSSAVSWGLGYADGNNIPLDKLANLAENILGAIDLPLSLDIEGGYSDDPKTVAQNVKRLVDLGVAGINIEDNTQPFELLLEKVREIRIALGEQDLYINFRTDVYLQSLVEKDKQIEETIRRGKLAKEAGADGLFIPGLRDADAIGEIVPQIDMPVHVMAWSGLPDAEGLGKIGVKRLSDGARLAAATWQFVGGTAKNFIERGESGPLESGNWELQQAFSK